MSLATSTSMRRACAESCGHGGRCPRSGRWLESFALMMAFLGFSPDQEPRFRPRGDVHARQPGMHGTLVRDGTVCPLGSPRPRFTDAFSVLMEFRRAARASRSSRHRNHARYKSLEFLQ